jgi:protein O-GlcNAc transferase
MSDVATIFSQALSALNGHDIKTAENGFRQVLQRDPSHVPALNLLTVALMSTGRFADAEPFIAKAVGLNQGSDVSFYNYGLIAKHLNKPKLAYEQFTHALKLNPNVSETWNNRGTVCNDLKQYGDAISNFDKAIELRPDYAEAHTNKGKSLSEIKRYDDALAVYDKALSIKPDLVEAWLGRANVFHDLKRHDEALAAYDKALSIEPALAEAWLGRGNVLTEFERYDEALAAYDKAVSIKPNLAIAWVGRGNVFTGLRRYDEAFAAYDRALSVKPDLENAWLGRGSLFLDLNRYDEALSAYDKAVSLKPDFAEAWLGRGNVFFKLRRHDDALADYSTALSIKPDLANAWRARGNVHFEKNSTDKALSDYQQALDANGDLFAARADGCLAELQIIYENENDIASRRSAYQNKLRALSDDVKTGKARGDCTEIFHSILPFYLAYQGRDDRDLQQLYGSLVCQIMGREFASAPQTKLAGADEKIKIGFVSGFFHDHSNWKIPIKGWMSQLDRNRFEVFGYHVGTNRDVETDKAAKMCDRFTEGIPTVDGWRERILTDAPHILIYPGLFMDAMSLQLAAQRLAPVQCNSWGHPDTSGMNTLDYFLSSDLMEPADAAEHYTEQLVRLPNLSIYCEAAAGTEPSGASRAKLGLRRDAVVFWCGQSLYKYLPQYDEVFARIAESVGNCQFVFIQHNGADEITKIFQSRLDRAFASKNLVASNYCVILPKLDRDEFVSAIGCCDMVLDSIGWSGCNSTLESLAHNLPIITMEAPLMRGRHSAAILQMMDVKETITKSVDEYVSVAARLGHRPEERKSIGAKIASNKQRIYRDHSCIEALEAFLERVGRQ